MKRNRKRQRELVFPETEINTTSESDLNSETETQFSKNEEKETTKIDTTSNSDSETKLKKNHNKKAKVRNQKQVLIDPSKIKYKPVVLSDNDYETLKRNIIDDPVRGYFYYEYLGESIGTILKLMVKKTVLKLKSNRVKLLNYVTWEQFIDKYRLIPYDKERLRKLTKSLDVIQLSSNVCIYTRMLLELLNSIYYGFINGSDEMYSQLSNHLVSFLPKITECYTKSLNKQYYNLLCKTFNDFFNFQSGFGNTFKNFIKRDSLYIVVDDDESLTNEKTSNSIRWTADEKDIFYEALARYTINNIDQIAKLLPNKSKIDIMNLYNALKNGLHKCKANKKLRKKLIKLEDIPIAYEMSEEYVERETEMAHAIEKLDESQFSNLSGEYRGKYVKELESSCRKLFNLRSLEHILQIINLKQMDKQEKVPQVSIVEYALYDIYHLAYEYTYELIFRLFKKKMNELTTAQYFELLNLSKSLKPPPNPQKMVHILNTKTLNTKVDEINYFDSSNSSEEDYDPFEADYYPNFTTNQWGLMMNTNPDGITIYDKNDLWKLGISKEEVDEVAKELAKDYNFSPRSWDQLKRKSYFEKDSQKDNEDYRERMFSDNKNGSFSGNNETDENSLSDLSSISNNMETDESENDQDFETMLTNAQDIDDLQSEDEFQQFLANLGNEEKDNENSNDIDSDENEREAIKNRFQWYSDEFVILDADTELNEKGLNQTPYISGVDLTTKGHEFLQKVCDDEDKELEVNDYKASVKFEHLTLKQLTSKEEDDDLNSELVSNFFSQLRYGGSTLTKESWKPESGGPSSMFSDLDVKKNVTELMKTINMKLQNNRFHKVDNNEEPKHYTEI